MKRFILRAWPLAILFIGAGMSIVVPNQYDSSLFYNPPQQVLNNSEAAYYNENVMTAGLTPSVHSATVVPLGNGRLLGMWYGGSREGHTDVALYQAYYNPDNKQWFAHKKVLDRLDASNNLNRYVKKIGNPVLVKHPQGPVALFYVTVSLGGWATSQINMALSFDDGQTWHESKRLVTSPFLNISTLVKNDAIIYQDGTIGITAYHELIGEFSEIIRVNLNGEVIQKYRMTDGGYTIQPSVIVQSETDAVALIRDSSRHTQKVHFTSTNDAGKTWSPYKALEVDNPNSAVYGFSDHSGDQWMVFNNANRNVDHPRNNMALALSKDGGHTWSVKHYFENKEQVLSLDHKYGYPWLSKDDNGHYHLFYTVDREFIKHIEFNYAWLEQIK